MPRQQLILIFHLSTQPCHPAEKLLNSMHRPSILVEQFPSLPAHYTHKTRPGTGFTKLPSLSQAPLFITVLSIQPLWISPHICLIGALIGFILSGMQMAIPMVDIPIVCPIKHSNIKTGYHSKWPPAFSFSLFNYTQITWPLRNLTCVWYDSVTPVSSVCLLEWKQEKKAASPKNPCIT